MSLLQDPSKALDQIEWYLDNQDQEKFPGAFLKAAGNLSRQVLEQVLFILAFYSGMSRNKYMKKNNRLLMADAIWRAIQEKNLTTGHTYLEDARRRSNRIRKFASFPRSINKWRKEFNETSHFRNPMLTARTKEQHIRDFVHRMRDIIDPLDSHLITAAVNEIISNGKIKAVIEKNQPYNPGIKFITIMKPEDLSLVDGKLIFKGREQNVQVVPADKEVSLIKWKNRPILVQHSVGISIGTQFITTDSQPINIKNPETILESLAKSTDGFERLKKHLKKYGITIERHE